MIFIIIIYLIILFYLFYLNKIIKFNKNNIYYLQINENESLEFIFLSSQKKDKKIILYCNGYLESINFNFGLNKIKLLNDSFFNKNIISYNYNRVIKNNKTIVNNNNILKDSIYFIKFILSKNGLNIKAENLILFGKSLGTCVILHINKYLYSKNLNPNKIILESPLYALSLNNTLNIFYQKITNLYFIKDLLYNLQFINSEIFILYGKNDFIINYKQIKNIINLLIKLNKKKYLNYVILNNYGHNNLLKNNSLKNKLLLFINK